MSDRTLGPIGRRPRNLKVATQAETDAGTDDNVLITPLKLASMTGNLPAPDFESSEQTVALDTLLDVAHGLGARPTLWTIVLRCATAELGYALGDETVQHHYHDGNVDAHVVYSVDATNMTVVQGGILSIISQSTKNVANITVSNWVWVMRAWK